MSKTKKSLKEYAAEIDSVLIPQDGTLGYSPEATAENAALLNTLIANVIEGTQHCGGSANVQKLVENIDHAKCYLSSAQVLQTQIERAEEAAEPATALAALHTQNKGQVDRAARLLNESRELWQGIKEKEYYTETDRAR